MNYSRKILRSLQQLFRENQPQLFPLGETLRHYSLKDARYDFRAALNVALLALPQGMAYAAIADLPIYYGIICSIIAALIAPIFSSSKHTILGPTNATAFMLFSFFNVHPEIDVATKLSLIPVLVFMVGVFSIVGAYLKCADLIQYVSRSVLVGYLTGAAFLIMTGQFKHILGVSSELTSALNATDAPRNFFITIQKLGTLWRDYQWPPILLGLGTLSTYLFLQKKLPAIPAFSITLALSSLIALALRSFSESFATLDMFQTFSAEAITPALPTFTLSSFTLLLGVAFSITFLASLENTVMAKNLSSRSGDRPDGNQDMFALGLANLCSSFLCPMPASGSLTRSALNFESGARTSVASILNALFCIAGFLLLLSFPIVSNIPKSALAGLVVGIAISLVNRHNIRICLYSTKDDAIVIIVTFLATLLMTRLDYAIFLGVALSITLFLRKASRPHLVEYEMNDEGTLRELAKKDHRANPAISIVHVEGELFFGAADLFRSQVQLTANDPNLKVIILRLKNARHLDATSVMAMEDLVEFMRKTGRHVLVSGATRDLYKVLKASGTLDVIQQGCRREEGETNLFIYSPSNPNLSTRDALIRAQHLLGTEEADIKIYYDPNQEKKA